MRVALDAGPLILTSGGLRRYVEELTPALTRAFPSDRFTLITDEPLNLPGPRNWLERRWWLFGAARAARREHAEIFHGTNFAVPYRAGIPTVLTLHDLAPWRYPVTTSRVRRRSPRMIRSIATLIITPSEAIRREAIAHFGLSPARIVAVPHAASDHFRPAPVPRGRHFLFVGTLEPRKNIAGLLEAWRPVYRDHAVPLKLAGRRRADFPALSPEPGLEYLGEVPESTLPALYSGALAVVYPSLYEGFGLPVLEAMQCGACVITSRDPAITEVAGGAALQAAGAAELSCALREVAAHPESAQPYRDRALRRAAEFSWERTARRTHDVYKEAIARFGASPLS